MKTKTLMFGVCGCCHLLALVLLLIATIDDRWWRPSFLTNYTHVFTKPWGSVCPYMHHNVTICMNMGGTFGAVQGFMILSSALCLGALALFALQFLRMKKCKKTKFYTAGACQMLSGLCCLVGATIFTTGMTHHQPSTYVYIKNMTYVYGEYKYPYMLAWVCVPLLLISGLTCCFMDKTNAFIAAVSK